GRLRVITEFSRKTPSEPFELRDNEFSKEPRRNFSRRRIEEHHDLGSALELKSDISFKQRHEDFAKPRKERELRLRFLKRTRVASLRSVREKRPRTSDETDETFIGGADPPRLDQGVPLESEARDRFGGGAQPSRRSRTAEPAAPGARPAPRLQSPSH